MQRTLFPLLAVAVLALSACDETAPSGATTGGPAAAPAPGGQSFAIAIGPDGVAQGAYDPQAFNRADILQALAAECSGVRNYAEAQRGDGTIAFRAGCR